jgi:hypothetical protein
MSLIKFKLFLKTGSHGPGPYKSFLENNIEKKNLLLRYINYTMNLD